MKGRPSGYSWEVRGKEVVISHHGREAAVLRGAKAIKFVQDAESGNEQLLMARLTGNYKAPEERTRKRLVISVGEEPRGTSGVSTPHEITASLPSSVAMSARSARTKIPDVQTKKQGQRTPRPPADLDCPMVAFHNEAGER